MNTAQDIIMSDAELQAITGYKRSQEQVEELHRQGFYRARRSKNTGDVILERAHYDAVCAIGSAANEPKTRDPVVRRLKAV